MKTTPKPRRMILDWLADKHCTIAEDRLQAKSWHLAGTCQVKWSEKPIPVSVDIALADGKSFVIHINAVGANPLYCSQTLIVGCTNAREYDCLTTNTVLYLTG